MESKLTWTEIDFTYHNPLRGKPELNFNVGGAHIRDADGDIARVFHYQIFHVEVSNRFTTKNLTTNAKTKTGFGKNLINQFSDYFTNLKLHQVLGLL